jgi:uncharacterized protein (TIGR02285 family)
MKSLILLLFISFNVFGNEAKTNIELTWVFALPSKAPAAINSNILSESHPLILLYKNELKEFKHLSMAATITRIEEDMKNKKFICYPGSSEYSRRREFAYLTSQYIQAAPQLVVTEELGQKLLKKYQGKVNLVTLMNDSSFKGALAEGRSYGESIDKILKENPNKIKRQVFNTIIQTVIDQIKFGRVDYTLEYNFFVAASEAENKSSKIHLMTIPLNDVEPFNTQYVACTKTPEGLEVIKRIDKVVQQNVAHPEYWKEILNSIPEQDKEEFKKHMKKFIKERSKTSVIIQ